MILCQHTFQDLVAAVLLFIVIVLLNLLYFTMIILDLAALKNVALLWSLLMCLADCCTHLHARARELVLGPVTIPTFMDLEVCSCCVFEALGWSHSQILKCIKALSQTFQTLYAHFLQVCISTIYTGNLAKGKRTFWGQGVKDKDT